MVSISLTTITKISFNIVVLLCIDDTNLPLLN